MTSITIGCLGHIPICDDDDDGGKQRQIAVSSSPLTTTQSFMPKDLPGLYWDEERNRYFPISSRPKQPPPPPATITSRHTGKTIAEPTNEISTNEKRKRWFVPLHSNGARISTASDARGLRDSQYVLFREARKIASEFR
jgi:hypothetical protein